MAIRTFGYGCNCDLCDRFLHSPAVTEEFLAKDLALHGWERGDIDLCKECVEKRDAGNAGTLLLIDQKRRQKAEEPPAGG